MDEKPVGGNTVFLLKLGELRLKGGNRGEFTRTLSRNLAAMLKDAGVRAVITRRDGRFYVDCPHGAEAACEDVFARLAGITGWAAVRKTVKTPEAVLDAACSVAREAYARGLRTFKAEARRTDKRFPLTSYQLCSEAGARVIAEMPDFAVDVHRPALTINIEVRESAYIYGRAERGLRGLPVGVSGRGLLLLSGGIDSPVAGFMMAVRGMRVHAVHFHAYPYTSREALDKAERLAALVGRYAMGTPLTAVNFAAVEQRIRDGAPPEWATVLLRMAMLDCASELAERQGCRCLVTGESLAQVASQTLDNIRCTDSRARLPVLRPLIGMDKEDIIKTAVRIGTYETSVLPYADCCALFSPPHPVLRGDPREAAALYDALALPPLLADALASPNE